MVLFGWLAFALSPSWNLDYGLPESTSDEILAAYGWSAVQYQLALYLLLSSLLIRPWQEAAREQRSRHSLDAAGLLCMRLSSSAPPLKVVGLGYATIVLFAARWAPSTTLALTRLEWLLGGDRFVIGSLVTIVALIGVFIVWPSILFSSRCSPTTPPGEFARWLYVYDRAVAGAYCR